MTVKNKSSSVRKRSRMISSSIVKTRSSTMRKESRIVRQESWKAST